MPKHRCLVLLLMLQCLLVGSVHATVAEAIRHRVEQMMFNAQVNVDGVPILARAIIVELYAQRDYQPVWPDQEKISQLNDLVDLAYHNGLDANDYPMSAVQRLLDAPQPLSEFDAGDLDILATETFIRIGYQLRFGKVNPNGLFSDWNFVRELQSGERRNDTVLRLLDAGSLVDAMDTWIERSILYELLLGGLARYRQIQADGGWQPVADGPVLRLGDSDPRVPALRRRLQVEGDLASTVVASEQFDEELHAAVRRFQSRHGLYADGVVGARSYQALNVPVAHRIDQLRASLERGRWVVGQAQAADRHLVLVNIASAQLAVMRDGQPDLISRVQVGKPYRQTPVFQGEIQYLVVNPTWTIPPTILRQDVLPKLIADADGYLNEKNMDLLDPDGRKVDHNSVDWSSISVNNFPYIVRQRPGPWNSLGQIKFIFPNSHFVFLHDTPSRELFDRAERAFSSGCIRVEHPWELAQLVMNDDQWDRAAFQAVLDTREERVIHLNKPMPVFLMYWTAMADVDGTVRFYDDIYGRDKVLLAAMAQPPSIDMSE